MPITRLFRSVVALAALMVAGCVAPPPPPLPPGQVYTSAQCYAGFYQCVLPSAGAVGSPCACPGIGAPSYGSIR